MTIAKIIAVERGIKREIFSIFLKAKREYLSHKQILDLTGTVFDHPQWKELPRYSQAAVLSYREALFDFYQFNFLEWKHWLDGQLISGREVPQGRWKDVQDGMTVYKDNPTKSWTPEYEKGEAHA